MARPRPIPDLTAEESYGQAAAKILAVRSRELAEHSRDVLNVEDIERLHDMRVATRRLRAALEVFEPCFPPEPWSEALMEVKALADALGERRDRDVTIVALEGFRAAVAVADRPGVDGLTQAIHDEQMEANEALEPFVDPERLAGLSERLSELVQAAVGAE